MSAEPLMLDERRPSRAVAEPPAGLPRLLAGIRPDGALTLAQHKAQHGALPRVRSGSRRHARERAGMLIGEVERAGLLGRGGAAFPTAEKLRAVARSGSRPIVVVNAVEAEPASVKDQALLESTPQLVLDGAILAAEVLGAEEAIVAVGEHAGVAAEETLAAIEERGLSRQSPRLSLVTVPGRYVAGQETALVNYLNGGPAKPLFTPPMPFERGVRRRPTLVSNVETLAHLALIARHGAPWFRRLGTPLQPGSTLVSLAGADSSPGAYEIEPGAPLTALLEVAGGTTAPLGAILIGGYGGTFLAPSQLEQISLSNEELSAHGATLGAGLVAVLSAEACPVRETARLARWLAGESARQCGPCTFGLPALAELLEQLAQGSAPKNAGARVRELTSLVSRRGACAHPDLALKTTTSSLRAFGRQFREHMNDGPCARCGNPPELYLPARDVGPSGSGAPR